MNIACTVVNHELASQHTRVGNVSMKQ